MPGEPVVGCHENGSSGPQRRDHRVHFRRAMPGEADGSAAGRSLFFSSSMYEVASLAREPRLESLCLHSSRFIMSPSHGYNIYNRKTGSRVIDEPGTRSFLLSGPKPVISESSETNRPACDSSALVDPAATGTLEAYRS